MTDPARIRRVQFQPAPPPRRRLAIRALVRGALARGALALGALAGQAGGGRAGDRLSCGSRRRGVQAASVLPPAFTALLVIGAAASALHGGLTPLWVLVLVLAAAVVTAAGAIARPALAPVLAGVGWLTVTGFSAPPYAQLRPAGPVSGRAALVLACCAVAAIGAGAMMRRITSSFTLFIVDVPAADAEPGIAVPGEAIPPAGSVSWHQWLPEGLGRRRQVTAVALAGVLLPLLTWFLVTVGAGLSLDDELLIYLVVVVGVAVLGGFWPAVITAVASSLLINWYFTPPVHTFTIGEPRNLLALLLFVTVAVTVSSVVHLAARRALQAARSGAEAGSLLALAQTVLTGGDRPSAVLDHLTATLGGQAELLERVRDQWVRVAASGTAPAGTPVTRVRVRGSLILAVGGQTARVTARLLDGFGAQAATALDRERLRTQAAQAEALAEGNRMRTALLAAVSHDLRTPLASIKASVSTLRQADVDWTVEDEAALLATIEDSADRLDDLIGNLLDASHLATGSLQPFLRAVAVDEVVPIALGGLEASRSVELVIPDGLPLVRTDPGLLERVLANLFSNAIRFSPAGRPPVMRAKQAGQAVVIDVIDTGPGVPDEGKARMFEPFERLGARTGSGVGLGLAVARGFAEAMGAKLEAVDTPGGGLTMRITLPAAPVGSRVAAGEP